MGFFLAHKKRVESDDALAAQIAQGSAGQPVPATCGTLGRQQHEQLLQDAMQEDLKLLHEIKSIERKVEFKRDRLLPKYQKYVSEMREQGRRHPLLSQFFVWLCDVEDMEQALGLGEYCLAHELPMPERFSRNMETFLTDAVLRWSGRMLDAGHSAEPYLSSIHERLFRDGWNVPDKLRAEAARLKALSLYEDALPEAVEEMETALRLGAQVKTVLGKWQRQLERGE